MKKQNPLQIAALALRIQPGEEMIRLIPAGQFDAPLGSLEGAGPWVLTEQSARRLMQRAAARTADIVIDYEHQTLLAEKNGKAAPAAGWVDPRSLEWRDDGLYGAVTWTAPASQAITADEYRYLSPVFTYDAATGDVLDLLHVALTNTPAINQEMGVAALAAARMAHSSTPEDSLVDKTKLIALLGLAATATDQDIETAIAALKASQGDLAALRQELGVAEGADAKVAVAALKTAKAPDMKDYVPRAMYDETRQQVAALSAGSQQAEVERLIEDGLKDGRIAGQATAEHLRKQGLAALKAHLQDAPSIAALKATQTDGQKPGGGDQPGQLTQEELAVCRNTGITVEAYQAAKAAP